MTEISLQPPRFMDFSKDIVYCDPVLQDKWPKLLALFREQTGDDLILTCTWRSPKMQHNLWLQGRELPGPIVTQIDGINKLSKHNSFPAVAFDVAVNHVHDGPKKAVTWDESYYLALGPICHKVGGLIWGGDWTHGFRDFPHIELPG